MAIKQVLQAVDAKINEVQPKTMDDLISVVHSVPGMEKYGSQYYIVRYMGSLQGVRVGITGRSKTHVLPHSDEAYGVFQDLEKFEQSGYPIVGLIGIEPVFKMVGHFLQRIA